MPRFETCLSVWSVSSPKAPDSPNLDSPVMCASCKLNNSEQLRSIGGCAAGVSKGAAGGGYGQFSGANAVAHLSTILDSASDNVRAPVPRATVAIYLGTHADVSETVR